MHLPKKSFSLVLACFALLNFAYTETVFLFYNPSIEPIKFAGADVKSALQKKGFTVQEYPLTSLATGFTNKKVVLGLSSDASVSSVLNSEGGSNPTGLGEQAYGLRTTTTLGQPTYWAIGGDVNGAMYGGFQIAENILTNGFSGSYNSIASPFMLNRGMKLNFPLDRRIPTYVGNWKSTSTKKSIRNVWDMTFWKSLIDQQARNRYNVLTVWVHHPFPALVKVPGYESASLPNIEDFDGYVRNDLTHDARVAFWKEVMAYAHSRGMLFYFFTWNMYIDHAGDKISNLSKNKNNATTIDYMSKSMKALLETYPDLDGFGTAAGDGMGSSEGFSDGDAGRLEKTNWIWDAMGKAVLSHMSSKPDRKFNFIQRGIGTNFTTMKPIFTPLNDLNNVRVDYSSKYAQAHMYSTPTPRWSSGFGEIQNAGWKTWITVRNDDYFYINWGDPKFVRDFMYGIPDKAAVIGMYIGSDGYSPTRTYFMKNNAFNGQLEVNRRWYMEMLWGRIAYDPQISDDVFKNLIAQRYNTTSDLNLFNSWTLASRSLPKVTELVMKNWNLDFHWWPEACWSDPGRAGGFKKIDGSQGFSSTDVAPGTELSNNLCNISTSAAGNCGSKKSSYTLANEMQADAQAALNIISGVSNEGKPELDYAIKNITQMAHLSNYYAEKIRGSTFKQAGNTAQARDAMTKAYCSWMNYTNSMDEVYKGDSMREVEIYPDWRFGDDAVKKEVTDLGGTIPSQCSGTTTPQNYTLTITSNNGTVNKSPSANSYASGTLVNLSAVANSGYTFTNWSGDLSGTSSNASIVMNGNKNITANFNSTGGGGSTGGNVTALTSWVSGTNVPKTPGSNRLLVVMVMGEHSSSNQVNEVKYGDKVMKKETQALNVSGFSTYSSIFTLKESDIVAANSTTLGVTWATQMSTYDVVSVMLANVDQANPIQNTTNAIAVGYNVSTLPVNTSSGDLVIFSGATATNNTVRPLNNFTSAFEGTSTWGDAFTGFKAGTGSSEIPGFSQDANGRMALAALVVKKSGSVTSTNFTLNVSSIGGTVTLNPPGGTYTSGTIVTLTASPNSGNVFTGWSGDASGTSLTTTVTMNSNKNVSANFTTSSTGGANVTALSGWVSGTNMPKAAGNNRLLVVMVMGEYSSSNQVTEVKYGDKVMKKETQALNVSGFSTYASIFTLKESEIVSANSTTIGVTWATQMTSYDVVSVMLGNVNQTNPIAAPVNQISSLSQVSTLPVSASSGDLVIMSGATASNNTTTFLNGFTSAFEGTSNWGDAIAGFKPGTGSSETPSFSQLLTGRMALSAVVVKKN